MFNKIMLVALLSAMLFLSAACDSLETVERNYPNYKELAKVDEPGNWVPSFIPRTAVQIRAKYKIDTGAELLTFYFREYGDISLDTYCNKVTANNIELPLSGFLGDATWWPDSLSRNHIKSEELNQYEFYRCERQAFLALKRSDDHRHQGFYWRINLH